MIARRPGAATHRNQRRRPLKVLLVEDNPDYRRLVREMLRKAHETEFEIESADSLSAARKRIAEKEFDIVLLDLNLPDSSGIDTFFTLHAAFPHLPFIILTGTKDEALAAEAARAGAQDWIVKEELAADPLLRSMRYAIERHRMQQEMYTSNKRFYKVIHDNADGFAVVDESGVVMMVNPAAEAMLGRKARDIVGAPFGYDVTPDGMSEVEIRRADGTIVVAEMRTVRIEWAGKKAYLASLRDITERKRLEEALRASEEIFRSVVQNSSDIVAILTPEMKVRYMSPVVERVLGYTPEAPLDRSVLDPVHPRDSERVKAWFTGILRKPGARGQVEFRARHKNGSWLHIEAIASNLTDNPSIKGVLVNARDITERKQAERVRRELEAERMVVEKLKELDRMKSGFVAAVTHELRTPMTPMRSVIGMFLDGMLGELTEEQKKHMEILGRNVERLSRFATDVLTISRIEAGEYPIDPCEIPLSAAVKPVVELLKGKAAEKGEIIETDVPPELRVFADADAVAEVLTNLVNNAIVHNPEGTRVTISARRLNDDFVEVRVTDTGRGIPEKAIETIFEKFVQVDRRSGPGYRGTGLGLPICRSLIEKMGGEIHVESRPDGGSSFRFTLPAEPPDE